MPDLKTLEELLRKIAKSTDHVRIEIDYSGEGEHKGFHWKVPQSNLTASEYTPRNLRPKNYEH